MSYTMLRNPVKKICLDANSFEKAALDFIRDSCQGLRFDMSKAVNIDSDKLDFEGKSLKYGQIPYNMEKDVDRLCLENAVSQFLKTGKRDDAFNVYFCYLDMFIGDYEKTRRMIELLSEFEANGSSLLMRHRDHYSHSVYVFCLGLAIYQTNKIYRDTYNKYYDLKDEHAAACHYLQYWGATSLFHDIGYPFELPFEQSASYFEVHGKKRSEGPFMAYQAIGTFTKLSDKTTKALNDMFGTDNITSTDELFAKVLADKIGDVYGIFKAYCTRVGSGPFPTELFDKTGDQICTLGHEFGSVTGRKRRCGWVDLVALKYSIMVNGVTKLIMMKSDVLDTFETIKACVAYKMNGEEIDYFPYDITDEVEPIYVELPGWQTDMTKMQSEDEFPEEFNAYLSFLEEQLGVQIKIVSVGPDREQTIIRYTEE